ncbi:MAG TPA: serine hydrolase domain-containing protein, partial [Chitinophagaceae bacterium]
MKQKFLFAIIVLTFNGPFASAQYPGSDISKKAMDHYIEEQMAHWKVPGCAVAVVKGTSLVYVKGFGFRNVESKLPVTPTTVFKIASCTKSFTAAAAGLMVNEKLLQWDVPLRTYLPRLQFMDTLLTSSVTLRDLLTHRTGLYDDDWSWVGDHIDTNRMFEILSVMPQRRQHRSGFLYGNMTYALAGYLCGSRAGSSWRSVIRKYFFEPLGMSSSSFSHNENSGIADFAFGYEWADSTMSYVRGNLSEHYTDSLSASEPFAFISTSVTDLSKWIRLFINGGMWEGKQIIPSALVRQLTTPANYMYGSQDPEITESAYCMGWVSNYYKCHRLLQHSGGLAGFKSYMSFMPRDSIGVVVLTNGQPYRFAEALTYDLYDMLLGLPKSLWLQKFLKKGSAKTDTAQSQIT